MNSLRQQWEKLYAGAQQWVATMKEHEAALMQREKRLADAEAAWVTMKGTMEYDVLNMQKLLQQRELATTVTLNVGGRLFISPAATLTQHPDSLLALLAKYSGATDDSGEMLEFPKDKDGNIFLDADPEEFQAVLQQLRNEQQHGEKFDASRLKPNERKLAAYLGLSAIATVSPAATFTAPYGGITVEGSIIKKGHQDAHKPLLGGPVSVGSIMRVTVLEEKSHWLGLGLLKEGLAPVTESSYSNPGAHLHVVSCTNNVSVTRQDYVKQQWVKGANTGKGTLRDTKVNDTFELKVGESDLSITNLRTGTSQSIGLQDGPVSAGGYIWLLNMHYANDSIKVE
jgi:hypothetical protein